MLKLKLLNYLDRSENKKENKSGIELFLVKVPGSLSRARHRLI